MGAIVPTILATRHPKKTKTEVAMPNSLLLPTGWVFFQLYEEIWFFLCFLQFFGTHTIGFCNCLICCVWICSFHDLFGSFQYSEWFNWKSCEVGLPFYNIDFGLVVIGFLIFVPP